MNAIPARFWGALTDEEFLEVLATSYLNHKLCKKLWRFCEFQSKPPKKLLVSFNRADFMKFMQKEFPGVPLPPPLTEVERQNLKRLLLRKK